jgi:hypothetical protein
MGLFLHRAFGALVVLCGFLLFSNSLHAQSTYGQISGTVTDPQGGTVPGAKVRVKDQNTKAAREVETDPGGDFRVPNLNAGVYTMTISASGFADAERKDIELLARQELRLDTSLTVASAAGQVVEVQATEAIVSDSNTISDSRTGQQISDLALNFRATDNPSPLNVAVLTPAVQQDRNNNVSVSGGLPYFTSFSIDGVNTTNVRFNGPNRDLFPSIEGIAEFKVNTANNNAEFGQPSDLTVTTRSGTNDYHGAIYDFYQNSALNAFNPIEHKKNFLIGNTFGGFFGGPLAIPRVYEAKDKTFFYFDYEGTRRPRSAVVSEIVPPDSWRNGNLSSLLTPTGANAKPIQLFSPFTNAPIANNQIAPNATAVAILNALYPHQNVPGAGDSIAKPDFVTTVPGPYALNTYDGRLDHNFTPNHKAFGRVSWKDISDAGIDTSAGASNGFNANFGQFKSVSELRNFALSYNWVISSHLVNELRGGLSFANFIRTYPLAAQGGSIIQKLGLTGLPPTPKSGGIPNFNFTGSGIISSDNSGRPRTIQNHTYVIGDSLTWLTGPHAFKFGFDYSHNSYVDYLSFFNGDEFGEYFFTGALTKDKTGTVANSGFDFADFLFGLPSVTSFAQNGPDTRPFASQYGFYGQDEWKISRNLTVTYGLRYEIHPPFHDETNQLANFDRFSKGGRVIVQNQAGLNQVAPTFAASIGNTPIVLASLAGLPETLRHTYYGDWDPRLGIAWRPFGNNKTVLRASAGVYTVPVLGSVLYSLAGVATSNAPVFAQAVTGSGPNGATYALQFPNVFPTGAGGFGGIPDFRRANQTDLKDPRNIQWNLSVERDLGRQTLLRVSYVGSHSTALIFSPDLNQVQPNTTGYTAAVAATRPFPNFNAVLTRDNGPSAKYNAGTLEVTKRIGGGLNFQSSYTWAKNLSNALGTAPRGFSAENGPTTLNRFNIAADYGNVVFTRRHRFLTTLFWDIPAGTGKKYLNAMNSAENAVFGNWSVSGIVLAQSGPYLTPTFSGTDPSGTGVLVRGVTSTQRPDCVGTPSLSNASGFAIPADKIGRFGNCGVGILEGPGTGVFSATLGKQFRFTERLGLKFEAQFANLFNHVNPDIPSTNISSSSYGKFNAVQQGEQAGPRTMQFGLRLYF